MAKIDKSIVLTDAVIDDLLDDWFERDGESFIKIRKDGRLGWEETLDAGESYSAYLLEAPTQEDLIKRAYSLASDTILVMNPPFKVRIKITSNRHGSSFTDGKVVCVNTAMFDDDTLTVGEKLDTFLGVTIHEGCHLLYSDFSELAKVTTKIVHQIANILEDERIEELCAEQKPGLANFLEKSKYYYFDQYYLDYIVPKEKESALTPFDRIMNCFLHIIRYPKYLDEKEIIEFAYYLMEIKKLVIPYPKDTKEVIEVAEKVFNLIKDFYESLEGKTEDETEAKKTVEEAHRKMIADVEAASSALSKVAGDSTSSEGLSPSEMAGVVREDSEILGDICEGSVELGSSADTFFFKAVSNKDVYMGSLERVKRFIPAISKIMRGHCRDYKLIHRSMRSGYLDTNKLADAVQGVPTVYMRNGEVKTDKITVCILIDESGSMHGQRIQAARDTAILINEALGRVPNVELFIYGHSGDTKKSTSTELYIYRENTYHPKYSLGAVSAKNQNRDGVAIVEVAKRVRTQTKNNVLFFILSDGAPCAASYGGVTAMEHVRKSVLSVEKLGFKVIQVCINPCYDPKTMFKNFVILDDMNTLAFELGKAVKIATMDATKVNVI